MERNTIDTEASFLGGAQGLLITIIQDANGMYIAGSKVKGMSWNEEDLLLSMVGGGTFLIGGDLPWKEQIFTRF